jgi:hypothetical protein
MLQRGMYFREPPGTSIVLMSRRPGAPYVDALSEDGTELEYEGHDALKTSSTNPKNVDQPARLPSGRLTENGMFVNAVDEYKRSGRAPARVRVYEKLRPGIWSDRGLFILFDHEYVPVGGRKVFRFKMRLSAEPDERGADGRVLHDEPASRVIPSWLKQEVYKRDKGTCVLCGASDQLHFDHDYPYSKGGTSLVPGNVRLLCARHNLEKAAKIQ